MRIFEIHGGQFEVDLDSAINRFVHSRIRLSGPAYKKQKENRDQTLKDFLKSNFFDSFLEDNFQAQEMKPHRLAQLVRKVMQGYFDETNTFTIGG